MYYTHRHFYVTEAMFVPDGCICWNLCAGKGDLIARFKTKYMANKARLFLQRLLDSYCFSELASWCKNLRESNDEIILEFVCR